MPFIIFNISVHLYEFEDDDNYMCIATAEVRRKATVEMAALTALLQSAVEQ